MPPWMHDGGTEEMLARLKEPAVREKIKQDFIHNDRFENWVNSCGWGNIVISAVSTDKNRPVEGKNMLEIAEMRGTNPADAAFDLLIEENSGVTMVVYWGEEEDVMYGIKHPLQIVGSDGIFGGKPHPRLYGTFPRVLGRYVREKKVLTLAEAIRHMSGAPAQLLRLKDRGLLREGYWADVVVFDPETVTDCSTFEEPLREPIGIKYVILTLRTAKAVGFLEALPHPGVLPCGTKRSPCVPRLSPIRRTYPEGASLLGECFSRR
jgi:N-acyl-D-amino-acid deacylase